MPTLPSKPLPRPAPRGSGMGLGSRPGALRKRVDGARGAPMDPPSVLPPGPLLGSRRPPWPAMETQRASAHPERWWSQDAGVLRGPGGPHPDGGGREGGPWQDPAWAEIPPQHLLLLGSPNSGLSNKGEEQWLLEDEGLEGDSPGTAQAPGGGGGGHAQGKGWAGAGGRESQCWGGGRTQVAMAPSPGAGLSGWGGCSLWTLPREPRQPGPRGGA